jgi:hypothetical protein
MGVRLAIIITVLLPAVALGDDAPRALRVAPGYVATQPGWFFTDEGKERVDASIRATNAELAQLREENKTLQQSVTTVSASPSLTWKGTLILVAVGLVVGAAVAIPVTKATGR